MSNEHAELGAPVPDVVEPHHVVAEKLEQPADRVTDNCWSKFKINIMKAMKSQEAGKSLIRMDEVVYSRNSNRLK